MSDRNIEEMVESEEFDGDVVSTDDDGLSYLGRFAGGFCVDAGPFGQSMTTSVSITELMSAILEVQKKLKNLRPNRIARNRTFEYQYIDLGALIDEIKPLLLEHGIVWQTFPVSDENKNPGIVSLLFHVPSQQYIVTQSFISLESHPHAYGAAFTYLRKYILQGLSSVAAEIDDDASGGFTVAISNDQQQATQVQERVAEQQQQQPQTDGPETRIRIIPRGVAELKSGVHTVERNGKTIKKPWSMWKIQCDNASYVTFDTKLAGIIRDNYIGKPVTVVVENTQHGLRVVGLVKEAGGSSGQPPSAEAGGLKE